MRESTNHCSCKSNDDKRIEMQCLAPMTYERRPLNDWLDDLADLSAEVRLKALSCIGVFAEADRNIFPFVQIVNRLFDCDDRVRVSAVNLLQAYTPSRLAVRHLINAVVETGALPQEYAEMFADESHLSGDPSVSQKDLMLYGWIEVAIVLGEAVLSWAATRILTQLFGNGVKLPDMVSEAAVDITDLIKAALDQNALRECVADTSALADDLRTYLNSTPPQIALLSSVLTKASTTVRRAQSLDLSGVGCFSIAANLRLLAIQELVQNFGGSRQQFVDERNEYASYIESKFTHMQAFLNARLAGTGPCTVIEGDSMYGGSCATYWFLDGERQYVRGSGDKCRIFAPQGTLGCYCNPWLEPRPGDCIPDVCRQQMGSKRRELQGELDSRMADLQSVVNKWRGAPIS